ncbi:MAG TPA: hypothetical protein VK163_00925 [Opitutaceae bacterium]|nr:hypothetical protein [Opitutaceae bacterium]
MMLSLLAQAEPAAQPISIQTALLIILGIACVIAIKSLADLHRRVDELAARITPQAKPAPRSVPAQELSPEVLAVISAAVYESLGTDYRIVSINTEGQGATWSMEGRRQIFGSRKVR